MFCVCGTLIHVASESRKIVCLRCKRENSIEMLKPVCKTVNIKKEAYFEQIEVKGAKIKHECPGCGNEEMMYNTAQLRSADEGQTVFYSCECGYKFTVQS
ncbi:subunit M of DNA-directed RNA polymerase [Ordospora colligata]|uniref:DNA-directed RNA polymerase I subunit RPA12 n=1 Tax=Ordospora colligata OC4 TaxID=1354746 RepID=A0A0B2UDS4_9MICR|nr:subunit M of DNA-directed RNA polymerase [Ordospora colligata OC4]KHN69206.1 subunit M of DNA-directed RNA polymerase [Ordospora colligata OC4]TBU14484.1 subunit M of DNA-directed RNA polymerase [Ordospora colligata]TBU14661.1 subunit M of DNA-directed RNA polymerase [Ordospora colligata]TBU18046.1 subunit M of DNA-directed RNA polymerase [Ordospora colligata]